MEEKSKKPANKKNLLIIIVVVIVVLGIGIGIGYKKVQEKISDSIVSGLLSRSTQGEVKVGDGGKTVTYKGEDGEFNFEGENKLIDEFPSDFPVYPGANLTGSWSAKTDSGEGVSAIWETEDELSNVSDYYKKVLVDNGWEVTSNFTQNDFSTLSFDKGELKGILALAVTDQKVTISVTFGTE